MKEQREANTTAIYRERGEGHMCARTYFIVILLHNHFVTLMSIESSGIAQTTQTLTCLPMYPNHRFTHSHSH